MQFSNEVLALITISMGIIAILYASVGLAGASTYTALLAVAGVNYAQIPNISLSLNLIVSTIALVTYWRGGHIDWRLVWPFLLASMPMAYVGGLLDLSRPVFMMILLASLLLIAARIYLLPELSFQFNLGEKQRTAVALAVGGPLGFVAGIVGIGGGILLVPLIILFALAPARNAAAIGTVFVFVNSLTGLVARLQNSTLDFQLLIPLAGAVFIGGLMGANMGAFRLAPRTIQKVLGVVILVAAAMLSKELL